MKSTITITKEKLSTGKIIFIAKHKELGVASQGFSISEAKKNLKEAVMLCKKHSSADKS